MYLEIDNFDEYSDELSAENLAKVQAFAQAVAASHQSADPVRSVSVIGHADRALRLPPDQREAKEIQVSVARGTRALDVIKAEVGRHGGDALVTSIQFFSTGAGSLHRKVVNPANEAEMRLNRRVEATTISSSGAILHALPEWPPHEPDLGDPALDKVFSFKIIEGVSGAGLFQYTFAVWDRRESRAAAFDYRGIAASHGASSPFTSESDWADMQVPPTATLESLDGWASHAVATAPFSFMVLHVSAGSTTVPMGLAMGIALESGSGEFVLARESIQQPFNG